MDEDNGFSLHFATSSAEDNWRFENWYKMPLKRDFIKTVQEYGRLPNCSVKSQLEEFKSLNAKIAEKDLILIAKEGEIEE